MKKINIGKVENKPTKRRWFVLFLVCIITFINYLDRANISVAAPFISKEFGFDAAKMGLIFSAMGILGAFSYIFIIGKPKRIEISD